MTNERENESASQTSASNRPAESSLAKQSVLILSAKVIGFVLGVLLPLLVVRHLSQVSVGIYRQSFLLIVSATSILPLGFSMSAYYFLNRAPEHRKSTILNIVLFNAVAGGLAFAFLLLYPSALGMLFQDDQMTAVAPAIGLAIWLAIFSTFLETVALANKEAGLASVIIILAQLTRSGLMAGAAVFFNSADAIIYAAIIHGAAQTAVLLYYLNARFPAFWRSFDWDFFKGHLRYAIPFGFAALLYTSQADLHHYFVASEFSSADYAVYAYGCFQLPLIWALYESISAVLLPRMSELQSKGQTHEMLAITVRGVSKLAFMYFPLFAYLMIVADVFVKTLFTERFAASIPIFRVNLLLLPLYCLILDPLERSFKELGTFLTRVRTFVVAGLGITLYLGVQHLELTGIIAIVVAFVLLDRLISVLRVAKLLGMRAADARMLAGVGRTALAAATSGAIFLLLYVVAGDHLLELLTARGRILLLELGIGTGWDFTGGSSLLGISAVVYGLLYLGFARLFGAIDPEEIDRLKAAVSKITGRLRGPRPWPLRPGPAGGAVK